MTIGRKTFLGYLALVSLTLIIAGTGLIVLRTTENAYRRFIDVDQRVLLRLEGLRIASLKQVEGSRGFLLYGDELHLQPWTEGTAELQEGVEELQRILVAPEDRRLLEEIDELEDESVAIQKTRNVPSGIGPTKTLSELYVVVNSVRSGPTWLGAIEP